MKLIKFGSKEAVVDMEVKTEVGVVRGHALASYSGFDVVVESTEFEGEALRAFAETVLQAKAEQAVETKRANEVFALAVAGALAKLNAPESKAELP